MLDMEKHTENQGISQENVTTYIITPSATAAQLMSPVWRLDRVNQQFDEGRKATLQDHIEAIKKDTQEKARARELYCVWLESQKKEDYDKYSEAKKRLPAWVLGGYLEHNMLPNGDMQIEWDHLQDDVVSNIVKQTVGAFPFVKSVSLSVSGRGVYAIIRSDPKTATDTSSYFYLCRILQKAVYEALLSEGQITADHPISDFWPDTSCKDSATRKRFETYDPRPVVNPNAEAWADDRTDEQRKADDAKYSKFYEIDNVLDEKRLKFLSEIQDRLEQKQKRRIEAYVKAGIDGCVADMARAVQGERNNTLFYLTLRCYELENLAIKSGVSCDEWKPQILDAAKTVGLPMNEASKTMASAGRKGAFKVADPGFLYDQDFLGPDLAQYAPKINDPWQKYIDRAKADGKLNFQPDGLNGMYPDSVQMVMSRVFLARYGLVEDSRSSKLRAFDRVTGEVLSIPKTSMIMAYEWKWSGEAKEAKGKPVFFKASYKDAVTNHGVNEAFYTLGVSYRQPPRAVYSDEWGTRLFNTRAPFLPKMEPNNDALSFVDEFWLFLQRLFKTGTEFVWYVNYIADMLTNTGRKPGTAMWFVSRERGTGKNLCSEVIPRFLVGDRHVRVSKDLSKFTGRLDMLLICFSEIKAKDIDQQQMKALCTDDKAVVELKGVDAFTVDNVLRITGSSNEDSLGLVDAEEDRRFTIFSFTHSTEKDKWWSATGEDGKPIPSHNQERFRTATERPGDSDAQMIRAALWDKFVSYAQEHPVSITKPLDTEIKNAQKLESILSDPTVIHAYTYLCNSSEQRQASDILKYVNDNLKDPISPTKLGLILGKAIVKDKTSEEEKALFERIKGAGCNFWRVTEYGRRLLNE